MTKKQKTCCIWLIWVIFFSCMIVSIYVFIKQSQEKVTQKIVENHTVANTSENEITSDVVIINNDPPKKEIHDWRLLLVNYENPLPEGYQMELSMVQDHKQVDARIAEELTQMLEDMQADGVTDVWVQSAYRDIDYQENLYTQKIDNYMKEGLPFAEAEALTLRAINKPGTSEHNLGLAIDFNYVDFDFDKTQAFTWLTNYAENYGFILRYQDEKESITKVEYEPWHWRYVGVEHAKRINQLHMCLEEYITYLEGGGN